jgi:hypothetical protein
VSNIDAVIFDNGIGATFEAGTGLLPFITRDTLYWTNQGTMLGEPGFAFNTTTATTQHSAATFYNTGSIVVIDEPAVPEYVENTAGTAFEQFPPESGPLGSSITVNATNIVSSGSLLVGQAGLLQLTGNNVDLSGGFVGAGYPSDSYVLTEYNTTGGGGTYELDSFVDTSTSEYFVNPPTVYDLVWGVTNGFQQDVSAGSWYLSPTPTLNLRGNGAGTTVVSAGGGGTGVVTGLGLTGLFEGSLANMTAYVSTSQTGVPNVPNATNFYYTVVLVNTNFNDPNISANVLFYPPEPQVQAAASLVPPTQVGVGEIVQFTEQVVDLSTETTVSNSIYLLDSGGELSSSQLAINAAYANGYGRPNSFDITTTMPLEWDDAIQDPQAYQANAILDTTKFYVPFEFANQKPNIYAAAYAVQVGRDPEVLGGLDPATSDTLGSAEVDLPDPTNEAGRVEINAHTLKLANTRIQAEGVVTLNATNLVGATYGSEWGNFNSSLGSRTNKSLLVSNVFPAAFHRLRGDIAAWSATWSNTQTNDNKGNTNAAFSVTNNWYYHILVVNQDLRGTYQSTALNLALRATNVVVQDNLRVLNSVLITATNLTLNGTNVFTENAGSLTQANLPELKSLLINSNAIVEVDNEFDIGYDQDKGTTGPAGRKYTVNSVTNLGLVEGAVLMFDCASFENDGLLYGDEGAILVEAGALDMGRQAPGIMEAYSTITLSAHAIQVSGSTIYAGASGSGALILDTDATGELTDLVSGAPSTNTPLVNYWETTDGFTLLQKPATGDLFGTEIVTIAEGLSVVDHVWAGTDMGAKAAGFVNNVVIGHLTLSLQSTNATLRFTGAGAKNGMYVDYLDFDTNSLFNTDFQSGLLIDSNLTIYFADSNIDPFKLQFAYSNRLVWVPDFAGPNSTQAVPYKNSSQVCLMNAALATSPDISFFPGFPPNYDRQPYVLNNPTNSAIYLDCPGQEATESAFLISRSGTNLAMASITVNGAGRVSPVVKSSQLALGKTYTLTAVASNGWNFAGWGLSGSDVISSNGAVLKFKLEGDTEVVANFVEQPFFPLQGLYNGLFYPTNQFDPANSGFITLALSRSGAYSGRLAMGPQTYRFSHKFPTNGVDQVIAKDGKRSPLTVNLHLDMTGKTNAITGDVPAASDAQLWADLSPVWTAKDTSPFAMKYTGSLPWVSDVPGVFAGDSYVTATVGKLGLLSAIGGLADGTTFSQSVPVSKSGRWPFYGYVAAGNDLIMGWVNVSGDGLASTDVTWSKGTNKARYYGGTVFTNALSLLGSPYEPNAPLQLASPVVIASGAGVPQISNSVTLDKSLSYTSAVVTLRVQAAAGTFSGRLVVNTNTGERVKMSGVLLQNTGNARGYFLGGAGTNDSGSVLLQSQ